MFFFGAIAYIFVGGNDIFEVMIRLNLFYLAILVLGLNIWTTNDNALYSSGLGLANIFNQKKKPMVLIAGIVGTLLSVWLYYNFCNWLNVLNCTLPPVGIILVISYFMNQKDYEKTDAESGDSQLVRRCRCCDRCNRCKRGILGHCIHQWNGGCGCLLCDRADGEEE